MASAAVPGLKPSAIAVLELLRERGAIGLSAIEALDADAGLRLSGRILELRQAGFVITKTWEKTRRGVRYARYTLVEPAGQLRMAI